MLDLKLDFTKLAKKLISNIEAPPIPLIKLEDQTVKDIVDQKRQGMSPVEHRNKLTSNWTGIAQRNLQSPRSI